ncbi:hypothetical protein TSUD_297380 [Trifolium subterraneum]|uniref:Replication protein A 70 kDa DNA-binding subunit B/D first OB fold domain-containing protein n=1 Tax=Trifolium subterraneum TaxID=3900 RepID=A0A2Z6PAB1_TRISU|nr:hypothetical protein TSUD_297380 [Trifolium subterraneum]
MALRFDSLFDVVPRRTSWRFKARVARLWEVSAYHKPDQINFVEMVLVDSKSSKIHATVRKQLLYLFQQKLDEGVIYRSTVHPYKLLFQMKTKLEVSESPEISHYGLSLSSISEICSHPADYDYLVGAYLCGKCECALFGDYVVQFQGMVGQSSDSLPMVVQLSYSANVISTTRILVNPDIPEAISFRDGLAVRS